MKFLNVFAVTLLMVFAISCNEKKQTPNPEELQAIEEVSVEAENVEAASDDIKSDLDEVADDLKEIDSIINQ